MRRTSHRMRWLVVMTTFGGGCTLDSGPCTNEASLLRMSPTSVSIAVGESATVAATVTSCRAPATTSATVQWRTGDTLIAQVDSSGVVRGVAAGSTFVEAGLYQAGASYASTASRVGVQVRPR
jgi:uncharacterized protein YjdB